jgi:3-keto-disaccharide hydrolase
MTPDRWEAADAEFGPHRGAESMLVKKGVAVLKGASLGDGTIEFDVDPTGAMGAGVGFRRKDEDTYEDFYLRPRPACADAPDCTQYAPRTHGVLLWDLYPQYQSPAPLRTDQWNHVKLVVSGRRMNVYINGAPIPTLRVGRLAGDVLEGGILLQGPGYFARLTVTPGATEGLSRQADPDPAIGDPRYVTGWKVAPSSSLPPDKEPTLADVPIGDATWRPLAAEAGGLLNISRQYGLPVPPPDRALTWLRTTITSDIAQDKKAAIGWTREIWVFVNGKQVYADKNLYQPPDARKAPDGRCSLENGSVVLPLTKGRNDVVVAVANNFYGWGLMMRLDDIAGLRTAPK